MWPERIKKAPDLRFSTDPGLFTYLDHEHPEVFPHPSQTKQEPAMRIFTPQVIQSGASDFTPDICSRSSIDDPTLDGAGVISTATLFAAATGAAGATA